MTGRAQVIMIVTGIGARAIVAPTNKTAVVEDKTTPANHTDDGDLDIPAFLRRRVNAA
jgi:hypothetical protein